MGKHIPVLLKETLAYLAPEDGKTYVDLTLGRGGTSSAILKRIPHGRLIAFDLDETAIEESKERLSALGSNFTLIHANFRTFKEELSKLGIHQIDGLTMDLGVSSPQFDDGERGFSYREDAPLDMRMDVRQKKSAATIVNEYPFEDLYRVLKDYGEDEDSYRIAKAICAARMESRIETTGRLVELIKKAKSPRSLRKKGHPAKQTFQALRIETNDELGNLEAVLKDFDDILAPGGRVVAISFHSLEDRLIKQRFRALTVVEGSRSDIALRPEDIVEAPYIALTKKAVAPSDEELENNPRSASAKLRAIIKK